MSAGFCAVQWNRAKLVYDGILLAGVVLYIGAYLTLVYWLDPPKDQLAAIEPRQRPDRKDHRQHEEGAGAESADT